MPGSTPRFGFPYAQAGDLLTDWPARSQELAQDLEAAMLTAYKSAAEPFTSYPYGVSSMSLSAAQAVDGGWPEGASATVVTVRRSLGDVAGQFWLLNVTAAPEVRYRSTSSAASTWGPWITLGSIGTARAQATGYYDFPPSSGNQSRTIAFPTGRFKTAPTVIVSGNIRDSIMTATAISATGFTANSGPEAGAGSNGRRVYWLATEMND